MHKDYEAFIERATHELAWDVYCSIDPIRLNKKHLRQRQLAKWYQFYESGVALPFGKIVDDQCEHYKEIDSRAVRFKNWGDMVDAEMHTSVALGHQYQDKLHMVHSLTYPPKCPNTIPERNKLTLGSVSHIEKVLDIEIEKQPGEIMVLDRESYDVLERHQLRYRARTRSSPINSSFILIFNDLHSCN